VTLQGRTVKAYMYVFVTSSGAKSVKFYLDDTARAKTPATTDNASPFDLAGNWTDGTAKPYSTAKLATGKHTLTVAVTVGTSTRVATVTFTVSR
jgi:hypothetical protein